MYHISAFIFILSWYAIHSSALFAFSLTSITTFEVSGLCEGDFTQFSYHLYDENEKVRWDFGDPASGIDNIGEGTQVSHRFSSHGRFNVNMIILKYDQPIDTVSRAIYINPQPKLEISSSKLCTQAPVEFRLRHDFEEDAHIKSYEWDFGDGSTSHLNNPQHIFTSSGIFEISVEISTKFGCTYTQRKQMRIAPHAPALFEVENACEGSFQVRAMDTVSISYGTRGLSSDYVEELNWTLGSLEGKELTLPRGLAYTQSFNDLPAGEYKINLKTRTNAGCVDEKTKWVEVLPKPHSPVDILEDTVCVGDMAELQIEDISTDLETLWFLDQRATKPVSYGTTLLTKPLEAETQYWVQYESTQGCKSDKIPVKAYVFSSEHMNLIASPLEVFLPDATIELRTTSEWPIKQWKWDMGDGNILTDSENIYTFKEAGDYRVTVDVESPLGCKLTLEEVIRVKKIAGVSLPPAFSPNGDGKNDVLNVRFYDLAKWNLRIFDLSGKLIYETSDFDPIWDGKDLENHLVKAGIYICVVEATGNNGEKISESKRVTVIR